VSIKTQDQYSRARELGSIHRWKITPAPIPYFGEDLIIRHESARLFFQRDSWHLQGTAVFSHDRLPCRLDYQIVCDSHWLTRSARVDGWVGKNPIEITRAVNPGLLKGKRIPTSDRLCRSGSALQSILPLRRLNLALVLGKLLVCAPTTLIESQCRPQILALSRKLTNDIWPSRVFDRLQRTKFH
jgi:hypothetical protein